MSRKVMCYILNELIIWSRTCVEFFFKKKQKIGKFTRKQLRSMEWCSYKHNVTCGLVTTHLKLSASPHSLDWVQIVVSHVANSIWHANIISISQMMQLAALCVAPSNIALCHVLHSNGWEKIVRALDKEYNMTLFSCYRSCVIICTPLN